MFQEIHYWERLMFEIPHYATDVYNKREDLRGLREHVLLVHVTLPVVISNH
jgi:dynein heavy chain